jgi:RNA polymerase primary sigma factor
VALAKRIERGDLDAKRELIERNLRLAVMVAARFQSSVPLEDLAQEAFIGLDRAATKFDWRAGNKFSTYAMWWIRHMVQRAIHRERTTIRVPGHIIERERKIIRHLRTHHDATNEDIALALELTVEQVDDALHGTKVVASLDAPLAHSPEDGNRYSFIPDDNAPDPAEMLPEENVELRQAMASLPMLERKVLELRFGYHGEPLARSAIALRLRVSDQAVGKAQREGMTRLTAILRK